MFRLISIALFVLYGLLALFGTGSPGAAPVQSAAFMEPAPAFLGDRPAFAPAAAVAYTGHEAVPLRRSPEPGAAVLRTLPRGTMLERIADDRAGFAKVRDDRGLIGFVQVGTLSRDVPI